MKTATHKDLDRLFPGLEDHTRVQVMAMKPTLAELDAVVLLMDNNDDGLSEEQREHSARLSGLLRLLSRDSPSVDEEWSR